MSTSLPRRGFVVSNGTLYERTHNADSLGRSICRLVDGADGWAVARALAGPLPRGVHGALTLRRAEVLRRLDAAGLRRAAGRPALADHERRSEVLAIRLSISELMEVETRAALEACAPSEWARAVLLAWAPRTGP